MVWEIVCKWMLCSGVPLVIMTIGKRTYKMDTIDLSKTTSEIFSPLFLYGRSYIIKNTCKGSAHLQCGSWNQYGCSLYHHAGRRNCPGEKVYWLPQWKRPDVPHTGTNPEIPEETWICAGRGKVGIHQTSEYRIKQKDRRGSCRICMGESCRCDRIWVSGNERKDIGK